MVQATEDGLIVAPATAEQRRVDDLLWLGFPRQYAERVDERVELENYASEEVLQSWIAGLAKHLVAGSWLVMGSNVGVGKSMAMARIALALLRVSPGPMLDWVDTGQHWSDGRRAYLHVPVRRPWAKGEVAYVLATDLADLLLEGDAAPWTSEAPTAVSLLVNTRVLFVDDLDRWLELTMYDKNRGRILYRWDELAEVRSGPGRVTVATANRSEAQLRQVPEFERWLSRVKENGVVLTIPGGDRRGRLELGGEDFDPFGEDGPAR